MAVVNVSLTFGDRASAERFKVLIDHHGAAEALRVVELEELGKQVPTVADWLSTHIDSLTGVQPATLQRYRTYLSRDVTFRNLPITAVTEATIARWGCAPGRRLECPVVEVWGPCGP